MKNLVFNHSTSRFCERWHRHNLFYGDKVLTSSLHQVTAFHQVLNVMFFNAFLFFCYMTFKAPWECRKTDSSADSKFSFICLEQCIQVSWPERLPLELVHWSATVCSVDQWFSLFLFLCQSGPSCELWNTDLVQISSGEEGELETWGLLALFLL